jgi:hypothetical protein
MRYYSKSSGLYTYKNNLRFVIKIWKKFYGAHTPHPKFFYTPIMQILVLAPIGTLPAMGVSLIAHSVPTWKAPHIARPMPDMQASHSIDHAKIGEIFISRSHAKIGEASHSKTHVKNRQVY